MITIGVVSLSGGQGKTSLSMLLGRILSLKGYPTLLIDADPQHNLTDWLGVEIKENDPTLLECLKNSVTLEDGIYPIEGNENLFIVPSDDQLDTIQEFLAASGVGAMLLRKRLQPVQSAFKFCIIDAPPQRSQICLTVMGAGDFIVIPAEASVKGYGSLIRTIDLIRSLQDVGATSAKILGVLPFRDKWTGHNQSIESRTSIEGMKEEMGNDLIMPSIRESEKYKQAINQQKTLSELGFTDLEYPLQVLATKLEESLK